ncbi:MAG: VOC family protein [Chloroflexi bacterium]|nr:VOC family protein [Acidobacteriota bacterium]MCA1587954.1 VOC family protein [Chloroflexota bacterium]MCA1719567.1 VOC family protein [Actinomycetota bacterium]
MITAIKTVSLYVRDQQRSRDFYVEQLGFEVRTDQDMGPLGRWIEVAPPGAQTTFVLADAAKFEKLDRVGDSADVTLVADDVATLHAELTRRDVTAEEPQTQAWGTFLRVSDPDGHQFVISERSQA